MDSDHPSNLFLYCCCYWQRRVSAYREDQFNVNVNTNNGVERKNRAYKVPVSGRQQGQDPQWSYNCLGDSF